MRKNSRRELFKKSALLFSGVALAPTLGMGSGLLAANNKKHLYPLPPGAVSLERFRNRCTACQLCVSRCPTQVLKPALWENGLTGFMQPILKYEVHQFCEFECKECIDVCPNDALTKLTLEEKKLTQIGLARLILEKCIVIKDNEACGACAEHCPTKALRMVPYKGNLTKPQITHPEVCIGCGACESICPELKEAIYIERHEVHEQAEPPIVEKQEDVDITDFGF